MNDTLRRWMRAVAATAACLAPALGNAGYFQWDTVELPASSGAACGNGTPYRFFVNRTPFSRDTVIVYEGGGACWDQNACLGVGPLSALNPDGVPPNYLELPNTAAHGLVTPFSSRFDPFQAAPTQAWNIVFLPYCTGDVHSGSAVRVYADADPAHPRVQYHRGQANARGAAEWLRANTGRPANLLLTGFSAGGVGATTTYALVRDALQPTGRSQLLADSGPLFPAPRGTTPEQSPSLPLHETIRDAWGLDTPEGLVTSFAGLAGFDANNLGTVGPALAMRYPQDRFGYLLFQEDGNFSAFSYARFYADIIDAPDETTRKALLNQRWRQDLGAWLPTLASQPNIAYHAAFWREFNDSHCLTIVDWSGTGIEEAGVPSIAPFVDNVLARNATPMRNYETDQLSDYTRPVSRLLTFLSRFF